MRTVRGLFNLCTSEVCVCERESLLVEEFFRFNEFDTAALNRWDKIWQKSQLRNVVTKCSFLVWWHLRVDKKCNGTEPYCSFSTNQRLPVTSVFWLSIESEVSHDRRSVCFHTKNDVYRSSRSCSRDHLDLLYSVLWLFNKCKKVPDSKDLVLFFMDRVAEICAHQAQAKLFCHSWSSIWFINMN